MARLYIDVWGENRIIGSTPGGWAADYLLYSADTLAADYLLYGVDTLAINGRK